jgi:hypothetical protein
MFQNTWIFISTAMRTSHLALYMFFIPPIRKCPRWILLWRYWDVEPNIMTGVLLQFIGTVCIIYFLFLLRSKKIQPTIIALTTALLSWNCSFFPYCCCCVESFGLHGTSRFYWKQLSICALCTFRSTVCRPQASRCNPKRDLCVFTPNGR